MKNTLHLERYRIDRTLDERGYYAAVPLNFFSWDYLTDKLHSHSVISIGD